MITTAVHQASQMVEIQGAPPPVEASGSAFRAAFTASVDEAKVQNAAQETVQTAGGAAPMKHLLVSVLTARPTPLAAQASLRSKAAGPEETAVEAAAAVTPDPDSVPKATPAPVADLVLNDPPADAAKAVTSELASYPDLKIGGVLPLSLPVAAIGAAARVQGSKDVQSDKPSETVAAQARKDEPPAPTSAANKDAPDAARSVASPSTNIASLTNLATVSPALPPDTNAIAQPVQATAVAALSQNGTKQGVFGSSGAVQSTSLGSASSLKSAASANLASISAGRNDPVSFQPAISAANLNGAQGDPITAEGRPARSDTALALNAAAGSVDAKAGSASGLIETTQSKGTVPPHPAQTTQPRSPSPSPTSLSTTESTVPGQLSGAAGEESASGPVSPGGIQAVITGGSGIAAHDVLPGVLPAAISVDQASPAPALNEVRNEAARVAAVKGDKPKTVSIASDETDSARSNAVPALSGDITNGSANLGAVAGVVAARTSPDAVVSPAQATAHVAASSLHSGVAGPSRAPGAVKSESLAEPTSAVTQAGESHRTLLATPTALEVGMQSGSQGWLRIRAEVGGAGEVSASLSAASSGGRELLHSQLPALNAFLHSEQLAVTATVAERGVLVAGGSQQGMALGSGGLGAGLGAGPGSDASGGSHASLLQGGGAPSGGSQREPAPQPAAISASSTTASGTAESYDGHIGVSDAAGLSSGNATAAGESGRWLNVRV